MSSKLQDSLERARETRLLTSVVRAADAVARVRTIKADGAPPPTLPTSAPSTQPTVVDFQGIPIHIDRPRGHVQTGAAPDGSTWKRTYYVDYGYVPMTQGGDQESLDVYLGLEPDSSDAYWILQKKADGTFDEYKVMLGFGSADSARGMYLTHTPKKYLGDIATTSVGMLKALLGLHPSETLKVLKGLTGDLRGWFGSIAKQATFKGRWAASQMGLECMQGIIKGLDRVGGSGHSFGIVTDDDPPVKIGGWDGDGGAFFRLDGEPELQEKAATEPRVERALKLLKSDPMLPTTATGAPSGEQQYVLGIVLVPEEVDAQGDVYSADEIRRASWEYMTNYRNVGLMHKGLINGRVRVVESFIAPTDMQIQGSAIKAGTWLAGLHVVDPGIWDQVKNGELNALSIGGFATKKPAA